MKFTKLYAMDKAAEVEGRWIPWHDGAELKIARASNPEAQKLRAELMKPYERPGFRPRKLSDEDSKRINLRVIAQACLKDWKGVSLVGAEEALAKHGVSLKKLDGAPYSPEVGFALLMEYDDFAIEVMGAVTNEDLFRAEEVEEAGKG